MHGATGTSYAFNYRVHDPRVGRFLSIDPLSAQYPWNAPYTFCENRPIEAFELEGREGVFKSKMTWQAMNHFVLSRANEVRTFFGAEEQTAEEIQVGSELGLSTVLKMQQARHVARLVLIDRGITHGSPAGDAIRHAFGQAFATTAAGPDAAKAMADAHEGPAKNALDDHPEWVRTLETNGRVLVDGDVFDSFVDQYNNSVGRKIGLEKGKTVAGVVNSGELEQEVIKAYSEGRLAERGGIEGGKRWVLQSGSAKNNLGNEDDSEY